MALSAQEQAELASLEREVGHLAKPSKKAPGLTPEEQAEMASLEQELQPKKNGWADTEIPIVGGTARGYARGAADALPAAGAIGGGILGSMVTPVAGTVAGAAAGGVAGESLKQTLKGAMGEGPKTRKEQYEELGGAALDGATSEMGGQILGKAIGAGAGKLRKFGEKAAVNATGATGKQASEFSENAGRELLDRKIVKFGDSQEKIAKRAAKAVEGAEGKIDSALKKLEAKGVNVDGEKIRQRIVDRVEELSGDPDKADIANLLENELKNLDKATDARSTVEFGINDAEKIKRGFNRKAGNWADPEKGQAGKEMYQTWRSEVEGAAEAADPELSSLFQEGKKSYGLLAPIEEAAGRRAATTQQSPAGGLLDMSTAGAGLLAGGPGGAVAGTVGRRVLAPRASSSLAAGSDSTAKLMKEISKNPRILNGLIQLGLIREPKGAANDE